MRDVTGRDRWDWRKAFASIVNLRIKIIKKSITKVCRDRHIGGTIAIDQFVNSMKEFTRTSFIIDNYLGKYWDLTDTISAL